MKLIPLQLIHKYQNKAVLSIAFFIFLQSAFGQIEYPKKTPILQEKLFVHTDKAFYLSGEIIWFKVYDIDGILNQPLDFSKVVYIELLDLHNKPVLQTKVSLKNSTGASSLFIPGTIISGNYILRAYTAWMKNFDASQFFEEPLKIVNTKRGSTVDTSLATKKYDIQFFPEGGSLVENLSSKVAFKIVDQFNDPIECKGTLVNQKKDTLLHFNTLRFGAGHFSFVPKKGEKYTAILVLKDTSIISVLPDAAPHGYTMHVEEAGAEQIRVSIEANLYNENLDLYLLTESHQLKKDFQIGHLTDNKASFLIVKKKLGDGISCITLFDANKNPVAERLYFKRPEKILKLDIGTDKKEYATREKVNLELSSNARGINMSNLSMSVYQINHLPSNNVQDILSYIYLGSELKGKIVAPEYYFTSNDTDVQEVTDNLMLTQGWRRFKYSEEKLKQPGFIPELEGTIINGTVIDKRRGGIGKNIMTYLSIPGKYFQFATSRSDSSGKIYFNCPSFYGRHPIILQTDYSIDSNYRIDLDNPFSEQFSETLASPFSLSKEWKKDLLQRSIDVQIEDNYPIEDKNIFFPIEIKDTLPFYGVPDRKYLLDEYTRFPTMEEVMREYVEDVMVRLNEGNFSYRIWNTTFSNYFYNRPLVMIDGLPIFNINKIIAFDPLKVKKIEVVSKKYFFGPSINEGIVSYTTYNGNLAGFPIDPNCIVVDYQGLQQQREFYSPRYDNNEQKGSRLPDFRNVLYWTPNVTMDSLGKGKINFYTSDEQGKYIIVLQGISETGLAGVATQGFDVLKEQSKISANND